MIDPATTPAAAAPLPRGARLSDDDLLKAAEHFGRLHSEGKVATLRPEMAGRIADACLEILNRRWSA